jgi:protein-tyrosine phosphatase
MYQFCVYVDDFLKKSKDNVVAVHCKGGKGRTGTMVASWLLYSKPDLYAEQGKNQFE